MLFRSVFFVCFALSVGFAVLTILKGAEITAAVRESLSSLGKGLPFGDALFELYALLSALILIFLSVCLARMMSLVPGIGRFLAFSGKDSLYHCGNELIIKYFGSLAISALGLQAVLQNDWLMLLYSIVCLIVLTFTLNLIERLALSRLFH